MTVIPTDLKAAQKPSGREPGKARVLLGYLVHDKLALISAIYLLILIFAAIFGPMLVGDMATKLGLRQRNMAPFSLDQGWLYVLGADTLGRSILARLVVGAQNTLGIAAAAVVTSMLIGGALGRPVAYSTGPGSPTPTPQTSPSGRFASASRSLSTFSARESTDSGPVAIS